MNSQLELALPEIPVGVNFSGGSSSLWMILAVIFGVIPRPKHFAVFCADTGDEHAWTYETIEWVRELCTQHGIPFFFVRTHRGVTIPEAVMAATRGEKTYPTSSVVRLDTPPFWTEGQGGKRGQLSQQCTQIWKSRPIRRAQAEWVKSIGLKKRIVSWIGYGIDEQGRAIKAAARSAAPSEPQWAKLAFPAIRYQRVREQQRYEITKWTGRPAPLFSMCKKCPFKTPERWERTPKADQDEAIAVDEAIRHGLEHVGVDDPAYLSDRLIPLERLIRKGDPKSDPKSGAVSGCDSGHCFL